MRSRGFLQTLSDEDKKQFSLSQIANSETNTIQCFFLERLHHLMKGDSVVGIIVPSTILSKSDDGIHIKTRTLLLQYFNIVSITEFGSGTFGKTPSKTVVLFLRRKKRSPEEAEHYSNRVEDIFKGDTPENAQSYQDEYLIQAYCTHINIPYSLYQMLLGCEQIETIKTLLQQDIFKDYQKAFNDSTEIKNLKDKNSFKSKDKKEQQQELDKRLITYLHTQEKDKLYYFMLIYGQKALIVNAPSNHKDHKQFLGYEWSGSKGKEGIKYYGGHTVNDIITPLFNPKDFNDSTKINTAIKNHFNDTPTDPLPPYCRYVYVADMLDFSSVEFDKTIRLNLQNREIQTAWKVVKLGEVVEIRGGNTF